MCSIVLDTSLLNNDLVDLKWIFELFEPYSGAINIIFKFLYAQGVLFNRRLWVKSHNFFQRNAAAAQLSNREVE